MRRLDRVSKTSYLKDLREKAGMTVRDLAELLEVSHTNIVFWENSGTLPRSNVLLPMSKALGVSVEEILDARKTTNDALPGGKLGQVVKALMRLPRRKQQKILDVVDAMLAREDIEDHPVV